MAGSQPVRRLLRVRELEEEQYRAALESAIAEQRRLEDALAAARTRERAGRRQIAQGGALEQRIAGIVEAEAGRRASALLAGRAASAAIRVTEIRRLYLSKRVERRQAETLLREAEALASAAEARRAQQGIDEWFSQRRHADGAARQPREKPEMKNNKEHAAIPEEELRTNP